MIGWDTSPASVDMARFVLAWGKRSWPADRVDIQVTQQDSLRENWPQGVDILVMNPPFKSWQRMDLEEKRASRKYWEEVLTSRILRWRLLALASMLWETTGRLP